MFRNNLWDFHLVKNSLIKPIVDGSYIKKHKYKDEQDKENSNKYHQEDEGKITKEKSLPLQETDLAVSLDNIDNATGPVYNNASIYKRKFKENTIHKDKSSFSKINGRLFMRQFIPNILKRLNHSLNKSVKYVRIIITNHGLSQNKSSMKVNLQVLN